MHVFFVSEKLGQWSSSFRSELCLLHRIHSPIIIVMLASELNDKEASLFRNYFYFFFVPEVLHVVDLRAPDI